MKNFTNTFVVIVAAMLLTLSFKVSAQTWGNENRSPYGSVYDGSEARQVQKVDLATVEDIRLVTIEQKDTSPSYTGAATGAALGGLLGSKIGKGNGKTAATIIFAGLGASAGESAGRAMNSRTYQAIEVIIRMEKSGNLYAITQAIDSDAAAMRPGDLVRVIQTQNWNGTSARLARVGSYSRHAPAEDGREPL